MKIDDFRFHKMSMEINKIYNESCLDTMGRMEDNSIDTIITDPPYGLRFMGKKWDYDVPGVNIWTECLRVLKPGGTAMIFAGSRTQHRMAVNIEDAGFILKDCIMWIYGSGFPKATDISKQLDKGVERKVVGKYQPPDMGKEWNLKNAKDERTIKVFDSSRNNLDITAPTTPDAQLWNGWKSHGLKPAYEPILVCMKPNDGTYAKNALKWGVSGLNIDGGRIGGEEPHHNYGRTSGENSFVGKSETPSITPHNGRYPSNVILDEEAARRLDEQSGELVSGDRSGKRNQPKTKNNYGSFRMQDEAPSNGSRGGASRFFYCAKASRSERNRGCSEIPQKYNDFQRETSGLSRSNNDKEGHKGTRSNPQHNHHPTVKPLSLMEYLCKLSRTPKGGIVYDPFIGSATTALGCINTSRDFIGSENDIESCDIGNKRIKKALEQGQFFL